MNCPLCGPESQPAPWFPACSIVRCPRCELIFYDQPVDSAALYSTDYFKGEEYWDYAAEQSSLRLNFRRRVRELRKRATPGGRLLEIGCAYGYFLDAARKDWVVQGIDIHKEGIAFARDRLQVDARQAEFLQCPDEPATYDVICLWDTIEHLPNPIETVEKAARWLKPGGLLAVATGDISSPLARMRGEHWRQIHPPTHLYYFSPQSLTRVFERAGLVMESVHHPGLFRNYRSMAGKLFGRSPAYRMLTLGERLDFPIYLNLFDYMVALGRKPLNTP